jgi:nondiscriminating aspartyl-tRNA synthetase
MGYIESFRDIMKMELGFLQFLMNFLAKNYSREIEILDVQLPHLSSGITEISFVEAKEMLAIENTVSSKADNDLSPEEEREICRIIQEKTGSEFVFVTHYPESKRPFYTKPSKHMPGYTESFDLLFRGIEITSGGQRINEYEEQIE